MDGKKDSAYIAIKQKIIEGELKPMEAISEIELANELQTSRTPIHQALLRLKDDGFIYIYPRKGTIVADLTLDTIHWMYETRNLLEPFLTRNACGRLPATWLEQMRKAFIDVAQELEIEESEQTIRRSIELDRELHYMICEACPNKFIRDTMMRLNDYNQWVRVRVSHANTEYKRSVDAHLRIVEALIKNSPDAAEAEARAHIVQSEEEAFVYNQ